MGRTFAYAGSTPLAVERVTDEPIVEADSVAGYGPIFNAVLIHHDGRFSPLRPRRARRIPDQRRPGDRFLDYISDVLVFTSADGPGYEFQQVLAAGSADGVPSYEDPRVQRVSGGGVERIFMSYTNLPSPGTGLPWRIGVHELAYEERRFGLIPGSGRVLGPEGVKDKDGVTRRRAECSRY